jgi:hypothetical protein
MKGTRQRQQCNGQRLGHKQSEGEANRSKPEPQITNKTNTKKPGNKCGTNETERNQDQKQTKNKVPKTIKIECKQASQKLAN